MITNDQLQRLGPVIPSKNDLSKIPFNILREVITLLRSEVSFSVLDIQNPRYRGQILEHSMPEFMEQAVQASERTKSLVRRLHV